MSGLLKTVWSDLRVNTVGLSASILAFLGMFLVYLFTQLPDNFPVDPGDWPFGTDLGAYVDGDARVIQHPISGRISYFWRDILSLFGVSETDVLGAKVPYAAMGAASFVVVAHIYAQLFGQTRAWIFAACFGLSLMVWYYAGTPESYALTTLLYSVYTYLFLRCATDKPSYLFGAMAAGVLFLAFINDVSAPILVAMPIAYFGLRAVTDKAVRNIAIMHIGAILAGVICLSLLVNLFGEYTQMAGEYTPIQQDEGGLAYTYGLVEPVLNYFFFSLAAPNSSLTYATAAFPDYIGFFEPSIVSYFLNPFRLLFLVVYLAPLWFLRQRKVDRVILAMLAFVGARFVAILLFNPGETIIYTSVVTLPLLAFVFCLIERSSFRYKTPYGLAFVVALLGSNLAVLH